MHTTPSIVGNFFAVALTWVAIRLRRPKIQVSLSKVHDKTADVNRFTIPQLFFEHVILNQASHG